MKLKIYTILIVFVFAISNSLLSQEIIYSNDNNENVIAKKETTQLNENKSEVNKNKSKVSYDVEIGSSFSTSSAYGNALSFYTAPELKYKVAPKLNITAGFIFINTSISDYYFNEKQQKRNINQSYVFSGFEYQASEKLRISGEVLYGINNSQLRTVNTKNPQDYSVRFNAEYKINENFSIGVQIVNQNMGNTGYGNTFGQNPFGFNPSYRNPFSKF